MSPAASRLPPGRRAPRIPPDRVLAPLRLFLGFTFLYAGLDKLADPAFLRAAGAGSIGADLAAYAAASPLAFLITPLLPAAVAVGLAVAVAEIAIGTGILSGFALRPAAAAGTALALAFWLTASWDVRPYYLGADLPYAAGALTLALAGAERASLRPPRGWRVSPRAAASLVTMAVLATASLPALLRAITTPAPAGPSPTPSPTGPTAGDSGLGLRVASRDELAPGSALAFADPVARQDGILVRNADGSFAAFSPTCPHAGCAVAFDAGTGLLVCPCHGATFDPAHDGRRLSGPTFRSLVEYPIDVDPATGAITVRI